MICQFITGRIESVVWNRMCKDAASGSNGLWGIELDENNISGNPALLGVTLPSWKRFQLIRGEFGLTIYGETDDVCLHVKKCMFKEMDMVV